MGAVCHGGDNTERASAASTQCPKQIRVLVRVSCVMCAVCCDDGHLDDIVDS